VTLSNTKPVPQQLLLVGAPSLFVVLWSTGYISARLGLPYAEAGTFLMMRFALAAIFMVALVVVSRAPLPTSFREWAHCAVVGALVHGLYLYGGFASIQEGLTPTTIAVVVGMQPVITAVLIGPILGEAVNIRQWGGFFLGTVGVVLVIVANFASIGFGSGAPAVFLSLLCVMSISVGTLYQKRFCASVDLRSGTMIQLIMAALMMWGISSWLETGHVEWTGTFVFALMWSVLVLSVGAYTLLWWLVRRKAATNVVSLFFLMPPVTAVFDWLLFEQKVSLITLIGIAIAVAGIAIVIRYGPQPSSAASPTQ
jgi:drug/metabolite transporter (DMT)-like permease